MHLSSTMIFVTDLDPMIGFYRDVIGLPLIEETRRADWAEFATGQTRFALHAIAPGEPAALDVAGSAAPRESSPIKVFFRVDDVDREVARLRSLGLRIIERHWGGRDLVDPEGNIVGLQAGP